MTFEWLLVIVLSSTQALTCTIQFENDGSHVVQSRPGIYLFSFFLIIVQLLLLVCMQVSTVAGIRQSHASLQNQQPQGNPITAAAQARLDSMSKTVVIVSIITVLILIAWLPVIILFPIAKFGGLKETDATTIASVCFLPNMIGNVVIYFLKSKEFKKVICVICKCNNQVNPQAL